MLRQSRPIVLAPEADLASPLSVSELRDRYGALPLVGMDAGATNNFMSIGSLIAAASGEAQEAVYSSGCTLPGSVHCDFSLPFFATSCFTRPQLWMGNRSNGACRRPHRDFLYAFVMPVLGVKQVILYAPK